MKSLRDKKPDFNQGFPKDRQVEQRSSGAEVTKVTRWYMYFRNLTNRNSELRC